MINFENYTNTNFYTIQEYIKGRYYYYNHYDIIAEVVDTLFNYSHINKLQNANTIKKYFTNNILFQVIKSAIIGGSGAILVKKSEEGKLELVAYDGYFFSGILNDNRTLNRAFTIDATDRAGNPLLVTYYEPDHLIQYNSNGEEVAVREYEELPIFIISNNFNSFKPFGKSAITREMIQGIKSITKLQEQQQTAEEIEANTRSVLLGVSNQLRDEVTAEAYEKVKDLLLITKDERNESPTFSQAKPSPQTFSQAIEAKRASIKGKINTPEALKIAVNLTRQSITDGLNNLIKYLYKEITGDPSNKVGIVFNGGDLNTLQNIGDSIIKINQSAPDFFKTNNIEELTGIPGNEPPDQIEQMANEILKQEIINGSTAGDIASEIIAENTKEEGGE